MDYLRRVSNFYLYFLIFYNIEETNWSLRKASSDNGENKLSDTFFVFEQIRVFTWDTIVAGHLCARGTIA